MKMLITGGAGFIGSNFVQYWVKHHPEDNLIVLDKLTYAGNLKNLESVKDKIEFVKGDITDAKLVDQIMAGVDVVVHFAAESHVDRSIHNPYIFTVTNVLGTHTLLEAARKHNIKRFHHISTDEVFGEIPLEYNFKFNESSPYKPNSAYSASKAGSDHLVRAYGHTYGLPFTISNCSNNFGPYHHPEKFIPRSIIRLLQGKKIKIYTPGNQVRDWLHVEDHCRAIEAILLKGKNGETYCVGGMTNEISNLEVAKLIIKLMGESENSIELVTDRPGHDQKYAVNWSKINYELGWKPEHKFEDWLRKTINWYIKNESWWKPLAEESEAFYTKTSEAVSVADKAELEIQKQPTHDQPNYIIETKLPGVFIIERPTFSDDRGFFKETFRKADLENKLGQNLDFVQTNHSHSSQGTLRGIHIAPWDKLVTCTNGTVQQIIVDTRPHSPTFGQHISVLMGGNNQKSVFIPKGCGNAFLVISPEADYIYQTTDYWAPGKEKNIAYNDPELNIAWMHQQPLLSEKDQGNPSFEEYRQSHE